MGSNSIKKVNGSINMRIITNAKQNSIGLIDNSLTRWEISIAQLLQALWHYELESIDETTHHIIACGGAIMAGQKVAPSVPRKKPGSKTSKPLKPAKAFRSAEFIEDSDEEATKVARKKQTPETTLSVPPSTKLARPKVVKSTKKPSKKRKSLSPSPEKEESTKNDTEGERNSESGDGSEIEESSSAQDGSPTPTRPKATASRPATNSAAVEDSVRNAPLNRPKAPGTSSIRRTPNPRTASPSGSEEDSESSESGNESGSESESSDQTSIKSLTKESPIQKPVTSTQASVIFEPPPGFESASIVVHQSSQAIDMFSPTNLAGKEIWHITAPSQVPISSIKEVSQQSILSRSSVLSYKGSNYGLIPNSSTNEALLLPSVEDNDYKSHNAAIVQTLHLQQIVSLPYHALSPAKSSNQSAPTPQAYKRAPRKQPEGLKMRYHPFGVVEMSDNDLSPEDIPKAPHFRVPGAVEATPTKKRKRPSIDHREESATTSSSKVKLKKTKVQQGVPVDEHDDKMDADTVEQTASQKQDASKAKENGIIENHTPQSAKSKKTKLYATDKRPDRPIQEATASQSLLPADIAEQAEVIMPEEVVTNGAAAIEIAASEEKKAKRRRRKEAAKVPETENVAKADADVEMRDAESPSRELEG